MQFFTTLYLLSVVSATAWCRQSEVSGTGLELESEMIRLVNLDRFQHGLPPLACDESLARVARRQSQNMARIGKIGHDLPSLGTLESRLDAENYPRRTSRENLARARSIGLAEAAFLRSPAHTRNLFAEEVTRIGIGIARGLPPDNNLYITQIFVEPAVLPTIDELRRSLSARIRDLRNRNGMQPVADLPAIQELAASSAKGIEFPLGKDILNRVLVEKKVELQRNIEQRSRGYRLAVDVQLLRDAKDLRVPEHLLREGARVFGTGAAETLSRNNQPVMILLSFVALEQ